MKRGQGHEIATLRESLDAANLRINREILTACEMEGERDRLRRRAARLADELDAAQVTIRILRACLVDELDERDAARRMAGEQWQRALESEWPEEEWRYAICGGCGQVELDEVVGHGPCGIERMSQTSLDLRLGDAHLSIHADGPVRMWRMGEGPGAGAKLDGEVIVGPWPDDDDPCNCGEEEGE